MKSKPGNVYRKMFKIFKEHHTPDNCLHIYNEGGSRSGKTFDTFDLIIDLCLISPRPLEIYVFRDTLAACKDYTYNDFRVKLRLRGLYDPGNATGENIRPEYNIRGSRIMFRGLDKMDKHEGFPSDIIFINEVLSGVSELQFENVTMRCKMLVIADWNPKYTEHWIFRREGRPNVFFTHSTFRDNPHCPAAVAEKILSYEPTPENVAAGTADEYRWKVYGLGQRAAEEGLVYPNITWINTFPADIEHTVLGMDFGFTTDDTVLARTGVKGDCIYFEELFRSPVVDAGELYNYISPLFYEHEYCYCDSADKYATNPTGQIDALQMKGLPVMATKKYSGSIIDGISIIKNFKIHIVRNRATEIEANSYVWDSVNGIPINKPVDKFNHFWDAVRYTAIMEWRYHMPA